MYNLKENVIMQYFSIVEWKFHFSKHRFNLSKSDFSLCSSPLNDSHVFSLVPCGSPGSSNSHLWNGNNLKGITGPRVPMIMSCHFPGWFSSLKHPLCYVFCLVSFHICCGEIAALLLLEVDIRRTQHCDPTSTIA